MAVSLKEVPGLDWLSSIPHRRTHRSINQYQARVSALAGA